MKEFEYRVFLGVDIGGSHIGIGIVGESGNLLKNIDAITDNSLTPTNAIKIIYDKTKELIKLQQNESKITIKIGGIGIGCPGQSKNGYIIAAGNLPNFINVPFVTMIKSKMSSLFINNDIPVIILNDADAAISAEVWGKHSRHIYDGIKNIAMITIGTGVGVGLVLNGSLYQGSNGLVEGGHMIVNSNDKQKKCGCGQTGCVEIWGSAKNTVLRMEEADLVKENLSKKMNLSRDSIVSTPTSSPQKSSRPSSPASIISSSPSSQRTSRPSSPNATKLFIESSPKSGAKAIFQRASKGDIIAQQVINEVIFYNN
jgi:glucokinase